MKKILLLIMLNGCFSYCFSQDNPYAIFGYKPKVIFKDVNDDIYKVKNAAPNSIVKSLEFDYQNHLIKLLDQNDSVIQTITVTDDKLLRFLSVDPISKKYPELSPYQFAANTPMAAVDLDGEEPKIVVSNIETGHTKIFVYGAGYTQQLTVATYKAAVQYTDNEGLTTTLGTFNVTRDGWYDMSLNAQGKDVLYNRSSDPAKTQSLHIVTSHKEQYGVGTPSFTISSIFAPIPKEYNTSWFPGGQLQGALPTEVKRADGYSNGAEFHVGGWFESLSGKRKLAGTYGCFGIVDPSQVSKFNNFKIDPNLVTPSNGETQRFAQAVNTAQQMQIKENNKPAEIQVEIQKRTYEKVKTVTPGSQQ
jgi:hypothetical protein